MKQQHKKKERKPEYIYKQYDIVASFFFFYSPILCQPFLLDGVE